MDGRSPLTLTSALAQGASDWELPRPQIVKASTTLKEQCTISYTYLHLRLIHTKGQRLRNATLSMHKLITFACG